MAIYSRGALANIAPQSLGETTPLLSDAWFNADDSISLLKRQATLAAMYEEQVWVGTVVDKIAGGIARLPVDTWDYSNPSSRQKSTSGYADLIESPCHYMSSVAFWTWVVATAEIYGEWFLLKLRDASGNVVSLIPMHPSRVTIKRSANGEELFDFIAGDVSGVLTDIPRHDIVAWRAYNPRNTMRGHSRMVKLTRTLFTEDASRRASDSFWTRGARPSMVIEHPGSIKNEAQLNRLKTQWNGLQAGADRMGGTAVLEEGAKAHVISLSLDEMQFIQTRQLSREEVCAGYDVPPPVVGILDKATYSNISAQLRSMYQDVMPPRLRAIESQLDFDLRPEFSDAANDKVRFNLDEVLRGDFETRAGSATKLVNTGVYTPSEARHLFDLPRFEDPHADLLYANAALVPLGSVPMSVILPTETRAEVAAINEAVTDPTITVETTPKA